MVYGTFVKNSTANQKPYSGQQNVIYRKKNCGLSDIFIHWTTYAQAPMYVI